MLLPPDAMSNDPPAVALVVREREKLAELAFEAGIRQDRDPWTPGGDLRRDVDAFTSLEDCVRAHAVKDQVLADAVESLGYDTLVRDACRSLQALHDKDVRACRPIAATSLRSRCETQVAVLARDARLCPFLDVASLQRDAVCLARARRDERLCAAAAAAERSTCRALVFGRTTECRGDEGCIRQVERFRSLSDEKVESHPPFVGRVHVDIQSKVVDAPSAETRLDFDDLANGGIVAHPVGDRVRLTLGTARNALWRDANSDLATPRLFLDVAIPMKALVPPVKKVAPTDPTEVALRAGDLTFDLIVPRVASMQTAMVTSQKATVKAGAITEGGPVRFAVSMKVHDAPRTFDVHVEVETFLRDVVDARRPPNKSF